jgi:PAS domain S-box-containing protein
MSAPLRSTRMTARPVATGGRDDADVTLAWLRDRAISATALAFTVSDPSQPDNPLLWANPAFSQMTGYELADVRGHNCRFLQGPGTDQDAVRRLRDGIADHQTVDATLLNYRKDGTAFWNRLSISPVFDTDGSLLSYVGVQNDVTEQVRIESERAQAYAAERVARRDAERSRQRLGLLATASTQLSEALDTQENLSRLAALVVPDLADWVIINLVDDQDKIGQSVLRHRAGQLGLLRRYDKLQRLALTERSGVRRVLAGAGPILVADAGADEWRMFVDSAEINEVVEALGLTSVMYVPLVARHRRILGTMTLVVGPSGRSFDEDDLAVAADLGRRAGITLDNARLYEHEHQVAETLQRSLLPDLPEVAGLRVAARYLPGDTSVEVGGDFYEILPLPDGSVGVAVGDVVGHDLAAAAAMGHLRGLLRACAWDSAETGRGEPAAVLDRLDRLVQGLDVVPLATLLYGRLQRPAGPEEAWQLTYANAGHPPPLLRRPDGTIELVDVATGPLLGVVEQSTRHSATVEVPAGSDLVIFTDGLIERRSESLDAGISRLRQALRRNDPDDIERLADALVATAGAERSDDAAVIVIQALPYDATTAVVAS